MSIVRGAALVSLTAFLSAGTAVAADIPAGLKLSAGKLHTDAAGAFISVTVENTTPAAFGRVGVSCVFSRGSVTLGAASTVLFSMNAGDTGHDQVRLLDASAATAAQCKIISAQ